AGPTTPGRAEEEFTRALQAVEARRKQLRAELVASTRRALIGVATQEQLALMAFAGRDMNPVDQPQVKSVKPAPGGGPPGWISSYMDQLRQMPPDEWEKWKKKFDQRVAARRKPESLAQDQYFMNLGEVVRGMPDNQYAQQKAGLAGQAFQDLNTMKEAGGGSVYLDESLNRFIDRCFLSP